MYRLILDNIQSRRRGDAVVASTRDFLQKNFPNRDAGRSLSFSFTHAINLGLTDMVKLFIEFGATMETVDFDASLTKIAKSGHIEILCLVSKLSKSFIISLNLISFIVDDNDILVQQYLSVALNQAIIDNKPDLVKILMHEYHAVPRNFGSQVFSETRPWNAAQEFAVKCLQPPAPYLLSIHDLVRCALARLGMKCYKDQDYDLDQFITPLLFAVSKNSVEMVTLLLQTPADLNNALLVACVSNSEPIVTMLIQAGADIHFKGNVIFDPKDNHDDVILIAQHYQHKSLINTLTKLGAK